MVQTRDLKKAVSEIQQGRIGHRTRAFFCWDVIPDISDPQYFVVTRRNWTAGVQTPIVVVVPAKTGFKVSLEVDGTVVHDGMLVFSELTEFELNLSVGYVGKAVLTIHVLKPDAEFDQGVLKDGWLDKSLALDFDVQPVPVEA